MWKCRRSKRLLLYVKKNIHNLDNQKFPSHIPFMLLVYLQILTLKYENALQLLKIGQENGWDWDEGLRSIQNIENIFLIFMSEIGWGFWGDFALAVSKKQVASILTNFFRNRQ